MTQFDISFVMNKLSQFMHAPFEHHWRAIKRRLRYLNGTRSLGIQILAYTPLKLHGLFDVDWAGNLDDRTSMGAFLIFLCANPVLRVLQSNTLLLVLPLRLSIVQLWLLLPNYNG